MQNVNGNLDVLVVEGKELRDKEFLGSMDPYLVIQCNQLQKKTKVMNRAGKNPVWNETLNFQIIPGMTELSISCFDSDTLKDDFVGKGTMNLDPVFGKGTHDQWIELRSNHGKFAGQVRIVCYFKPLTGVAPAAGAVPQQWQNPPPQYGAMPGYGQPPYMPPQQPQYAPQYGHPQYATPPPVQYMPQQPGYAPQPGVPYYGQPPMQGGMPPGPGYGGPPYPQVVQAPGYGHPPQPQGPVGQPGFPGYRPY